MPLNYYIGTSGWYYEHWRSKFYPEKLAKAKWLEFYCGHFATVEVNNSFYRLPSEAAFATWRNSSPANFTFSVKVSRFITHLKRLRDTGEAVEKFIARAKILGEKLGPLLYQLPPNMPRNDDVLESFLSILPGGIKHVFEFRHQSWLEDRVFEILHQHNVGFCVFDMPSVNCPLLATADFAYIRFHGSAALYGGCYSDEELASWAKRLANLAGNLKAIYIYFNNDAQAFAVRNALTLGAYL
ncbi:MAG: DUF72 domain-containing protein [Chloroflexi bacterium]|nr:DUF72 domain-containing protein [Chloroflexota bacterium]MBI3931288.1 DUF72 domain-containing protein [Chloroflexota bacterium]